jgi:hypothetical protein
MLRHILTGMLLGAISAQGQVNVVTGQYDNNRSSANSAEIVLNTSNVNPGQFGLLFSRQVDGFLFAQPLYLSGISIQGIIRNVVYVATMNNSIYAFDADNPQASAPLWQVNLGPVIPNPGKAIGTTSGILSTPVIDPVAGTIYAVAYTLVNGTKIYQLHALNVTTGQEQTGSPITIQASVTNSTAPDSVNGVLSFNAAIEFQRPALLLYNGSIYIAFATGTLETNPYHGWLLQYDATSLLLIQTFCATPNGTGGGVWMSGYGPAADANGVYFATGNGTFDGNTDWSESVISLGASSSFDSFTANNYSILTTDDLDLDTTGPLLLPGTNLLLLGSKNGVVYVLNRGNLGGLQSGNAQIPQFFQATIPCMSNCTPANFSRVSHYTIWVQSSSTALLYLWGPGDVLKSFSFSPTSLFDTSPFATGSVSAAAPGPTLALSSYGQTAGSAVLWAATPAASAISTVQPGTLHAFDPVTLSELWNSAMNPADALGNWAKYSTPTVANGKVYVPTFSNQLDVYGIHTVNAGNLSFGNTIVGTVSAAQQITFTNGTPIAMATPGISVSGEFAASSNCGPTINPGATCVISVTFVPVGTGVLTGSVVVTDTASDSPQTISLTGNGVPPPLPIVSLSSTSLVFGSQVVGVSSAAQMITMSNIGNAPLTLAIAPSGDFSEIDNCGATLPASAACTINVTFTPTAVGTRNGTITVSDNAANTPQVITLTGTGSPVPYPVPQITQLSPLSASTGGSGFTLTVNGAGFVPGSVLSWNGVSRPATFISDIQLQAAVNAVDVALAGTARVSVLNPSPGGGSSNVLFLPVTNSTASVLFNAFTVPAGAGPAAVVVGDLNGDGNLDVATANLGANTISIILGNGNGTFQNHVDYATGRAPSALKLADFNADGKLDIAVTNQTDGSLSVLLGNGDGTFQMQQVFPTGQSPNSVSAGDFNADGKLDLAVVNTGSNTVSILLGNGNGTFQSHVDYSTGNSPASVVVADFNQDNILDLAVVNSADNTASILLGNGDGTFQAQVVYPTGHSPASVVAGALRGNGILDLAVVNSSDNTVSILLGNGNGSFQTHVDYATGKSPVSLVAADFNGDGKLDISVSNQAAGSVSILLGNGDGTLQAHSDQPANAAPSGLAVGDFNGDGRLDLAVANPSSNMVSALLQSGAVSLSSASLTFAGQDLGSTSSAQTVTLSNVGSATLAVASITASGDFAATSTCATAIAPGASCGVSVTFSPAAAGTRTGVVSIADSASNSPQTINLTGAGTPPAVTMNLSTTATESGIAISGNTISLSYPAPPGGAVIALSSSNSAVASVPSSVTVASGATISSPFTITTGVVSSSTNVTLSATYATVTKKANFTVRPAVLYAVHAQPATISGGLSATANVSLYGLAPASGALVSLQSSNPAVASVPASVVVAAGTTTSPQFSISTTGVATQMTVSISATYGGVMKSVNLTVTPASVSRVTLAANGAVGGEVVSSNTVSLLGQAPSGGDVISLSSSNSAVAAVPPTMAIQAGSGISQPFNIATSAVATSTVVVISAVYNGITKSANLTVVPAKVYAVKLSANTVKGGAPLYTNRIILNGPAPAGGLVLTLSSSNPDVASPPTSVMVQAGLSYSAPFPVTTTAVTSSTPLTISASYGSTNVSALLTVTPP